jgi:hypothetical protein
MKEAPATQRFCGNCGSHNAYNYPDQLFCGKRLGENKNPIVQALWCCEDWNPASQECYCVREALKNRNSKSCASSLGQR